MIVKLRACPFCAGEASCVSMNHCTTTGYQIRCIQCRASTQVFFAGYDMISRKDITPQEAAERAMTAWNSRRAAV